MCIRDRRKRSLHNNYFTLPVVLCMLSNHSMFIYSHTSAWQVLIFLMLNAAYLRHFFNLRHQGISRPSIIVVSAILFVAIAVASDRLASGLLQTERDLSMDLLADQEMLTLVDQHCGNCHAKEPSFPGYTSPPGGPRAPRPS